MECEWDGLTRERGFEAFNIRFDDLGNADKLKQIGFFIFMVLIFPLYVLFWCCLFNLCAMVAQECVWICTGIGFALGFVITRLAFSIWFVDIYRMIMQEYEKIETNKSALETL